LKALKIIDIDNIQNIREHHIVQNPAYARLKTSDMTNKYMRSGTEHCTTIVQDTVSMQKKQ